MIHPHIRQIILFSLLVCGLLGVRPSIAQEQSPVPNLEVVLLIDQSYSMFRTKAGGADSGTDPMGRRVDAAELLINTLAVQQSVEDVRFAVVTFGTEGTQLAGENNTSVGPATTNLANGFISLNNETARLQLLSDLRNQTNTLRDRANANARGGWTPLQAGFEEAFRLLSQNHQPNYKPVVLVLTDGVPETSTANLQPRADDNLELDAVEQAAYEPYLTSISLFAAQNFPQINYDGATCPSTGTPVYSYIVRKPDSVADFSQRERQLWQDIESSTNGKFFPPQNLSDSEFTRYMRTLFTQLLEELLCYQIPDSQTVEAPNDSINFPINGAQREVTLSIAKENADVKVRVFDAADVEVIGAKPPDPPQPPYFAKQIISENGLNEVWNIQRPVNAGDSWGGTWRIVLEGQGTVSYNPIYVSDESVQIIQPPNGTLPTNASLTVEMILQDGSGNPLSREDLSAAEVVLNSADGSEIGRSSSLEITDGRIWATFDDGITDPGAYEIAVQPNANAPVIIYPFERSEPINVDTVPWVDVIEPAADSVYPAGAPIPLLVNMMVGAERFDYEANETDSNVMVQLYDATERNTPLQDFQLTESVDTDGVGSFTGSIPTTVILEPGKEYVLEYYLTAQKIGQTTFNAPFRSVKFQVEGSATPTPIPSPTQDVSAIEIIPTPTPMPEPSEPLLPRIMEAINVPSWVFLLCGGVLLGLIVFVLMTRAAQNRPVIIPGYIEDDSGAGNDFSIATGFAGRGVTRVIRNDDGVRVAEVHVTATQAGDMMELRSVENNLRFYHQNRPIAAGEQIILAHGDTMRIDDVVLRYENEELVDDDDQDNIPTNVRF